MLPRRTSEFLDEPAAPVAATARTTRTTTHRLQTTPSTAQKNLQRSLCTGNILSATRAAGGTLTGSRGATPLRSSSFRCALFATGTSAGGALHNDKRWVQEQMHRITEHLKKASAVGHSSVDFINHTSLRQMSIKNFVATINYFLQFMAGTRLTVGSNHVEDIVSVLQKLQYPYAVNKSWLKTPNTQHSFGNVILLFSFMLDFVPPPGIDELEECLFPLQESSDIDADFQKQMMQHCAQAFSLWDKQLMNEHAEMQQQTRNLFIQKRTPTGLTNENALERAIEKLHKEIKTLSMKCKPLANEQIQEREELQEEHRKLSGMKMELINKLEKFQQERKQCIEDYQKFYEEIKSLQAQNKAVKQQIKEQICTVQQRDILLDKLHELKLMFAAEKRDMQNVQEQNYSQQIKLSRSKQQFTVKIEHFNECMRKLNEIVEDCKLYKDSLQIKTIPLNVEMQELQYVQELLQALNKRVLKELKVVQQQDIEISQQLEISKMQITVYLQTDYDFQTNKLNMLRNTFNQQQEKKLQEIRNLNEYYQQLQVEIEQNKLQLQDMNAENVRKEHELKYLQEKQENRLTEVEHKHAKCMAELDDFFTRYEAQLNENIEEVINLNQFLLQLGEE